MEQENDGAEEITKGADQDKGQFLAGLAQRFGATAKSTTIFGDPIDREGVTVVPVAKARWGFGAGAGRAAENGGVGGGGGVQVNPIGYIEMRNGGTNFKRIHDLSFNKIMLLGLSGAILIRSLSRILKSRTSKS